MKTNFQKVFGEGKTGTSGASVFTMPGSFDPNARDFPGSLTHKKSKDGPPYGPPSAPEVAGTFGGMTISTVGGMGGPRGGSASGGAGGGGVGTGAVMASVDDKPKVMESHGFLKPSHGVKTFYTFVESLRNGKNGAVIDAVISGLYTMMEAEYWAKEASKDLKKGSLKKALGVPPNKDIVDSGMSGQQIAKKAEKAFGHSKAAKKLAFAANVDKTNNVLDTALHDLKKDKKKKD